MHRFMSLQNQPLAHATNTNQDDNSSSLLRLLIEMEQLRPTPPRRNNRNRRRRRLRTIEQDDYYALVEDLLQSAEKKKKFLKILRDKPNSRTVYEIYTGVQNILEVLLLSTQETSNESGTYDTKCPPASQDFIDDLPILTPDELCNCCSEKSINQDGNNNAGSSNEHICQVCCEQYEEDALINKLPCGHHFHLMCIVEWLNRRCTCPVCRYELPTDDATYEIGRIERMELREAMQQQPVAEPAEEEIIPLPTNDFLRATSWGELDFTDL